MLVTLHLYDRDKVSKHQLHGLSHVTRQQTLDYPVEIPVIIIE